jgi:rsbT co-antagonist protein RsbR
MADGKLHTIIKKHQADLLGEWIREQTAPGSIRDGLIRDSELRGHCEEFLGLLIQAAGRDDGDVLAHAPLIAMLERLSRSRGEQGFSPIETAMFVFSLKRPLFARLRRELEGNPAALVEETWNATVMLDKLGLFTTDAYQKGREAVILRQQAEMLELSTPVVKLWEGVLALPLIGTLDSHRTQTVMETLLQRVVDSSAEVVIIDITGVPTVDTLVAQHLMKTVAAARLMGVDCIISGIRPQIAQTVVHLGIELRDITTRASLADAFKLAMTRRGATVNGAGA